MNYCKTCKHWDSLFHAELYGTVPNGYRAGGVCNKEDKLFERGQYLDEFPSDVLTYPYQEGGSFWVGPNFGCVHHEPKP